MTERGREYGEGLYELCREENVQALPQLQMLMECFKRQPDYIRLLSNQALPKTQRTSILDDTLHGQVHPYVLNFLKILCERGLLGEFENCVAAYRQRYNQDNAIVEARATTATPLTEDERQKLLAKLQSMTGRQVELTQRVDPSVMGGVLLEMEGKLYDSTIRHRLESIRRAMVTNQ